MLNVLLLTLCECRLLWPTHLSSLVCKRREICQSHAISRPQVTRKAERERANLKQIVLPPAGQHFRERDRAQSRQHEARGDERNGAARMGRR